MANPSIPVIGLCTFRTTARLGVLALLLPLFTLPAIAQTAPTALGERFQADLTPPTAILVDLLANDSSPEGEPLRAVLDTPPEVGQLEEQWDGSYLFRVPAGTDLTGITNVTVAYHVEDDSGRSSAPAIACIGDCRDRTTGAENDSVQTVQDQEIHIDVLANDAPGLSLSRVSVAPENGTADVVLGAVAYTSDPDFVGTDLFEYEAVDETGAVAAAWVTVEVLPNLQPPVAVDDTLEIEEGTCGTVRVVTNDYDPDGGRVYLPWDSIVVPPQFGTARSWGQQIAEYPPTVIQYCGDEGFVGRDTFRYRIHDGYGSEFSAEAQVTVDVYAVDDPPVALPDDVAIRDTEAVTLQLTANDYSPLGRALSLAGSWLVSGPTLGTVQKTSSTSVTYTPQPSTGGYDDPVDYDSFSYRVVDSAGQQAIGTVRLKIRNTSANPQYFVPPWTALDSVPIDLSYSSTTFSVLANDLADQPMSIISYDASGLDGVLTLQGGELTYTPSCCAEGIESFTYTVVQGSGTSQSTGTVELHRYSSDTATFIAEPDVLPDDDPIPQLPPVARADSFLVIPNSVQELDVLANDTDENADPLYLTAIPQAPSHGTATITAGNRVRYTPDSGFFGNDAFTYQVSDGWGGTAVTAVTITVPDPSTPPVAVDDTASTAEDTPVAIQVVVNDLDWEYDPLRPSQVTLVPEHGTATILADGTIRYVPEANWYGTDRFEYRVTDDDEGESVEPAEVVVTVTPVNDAPNLVPDAATTLQDTPVTIQVLANDSDLEGLSLKVYSVSSASHGTATKSYAGNSVVYEPDPGYFGPDSFTYRVDDGELATGQSGYGPVTVTITVEKDNHPPVVVNDELTPSEDLWYGFFDYYLLSDDGDPDGDELAIVDITQPSKGTLLTNSTLTNFSYQGPPNWCGFTSSQYTVSDGYGGTAVGTVRFHVLCSNDAPVAGDDSVSTTENVTLDIPSADLLANDTDVEGHALSIASVGNATWGSVTLQADGTVRYVPSPGYNGSDAFTYVVKDSKGAQGTGNVAVTVAPDSPPVARFTYTCSGRVCDFDATASTDDQPLFHYSFQWDFPDTLYTWDAVGATLQWTFDTGGTKKVRLEVKDSAGQKRYRTKYLDIVEPPPVAVDDLLRFYRGFDRAIDYSSLTANDSDPDGDTLSVIAMGTPSIGNLDCQPGNDYCIFSPPWSLWRGLSTVEYTISDGHGETATATLTIEYY